MTRRVAGRRFIWLEGDTSGVCVYGEEGWLRGDELWAEIRRQFRAKSKNRDLWITFVNGPA